jgi:exodeoxyribonuclease V alpha subunit
LDLQEGNVIADKVGYRNCVFLPHLWHAEKTFAERLIGLASGSMPWPGIDPAKAIPWVESRLGFALAESQKEAEACALRNKTLVITGGPGVGKTTIVNSILRIVMAYGQFTSASVNCATFHKLESEWRRLLRRTGRA